jgi:cytochrome c oxidase cbb3-type subunit 4
MTYEIIAPITQVLSLLLFIGVFLVVLTYAFWPKNGPRFEQAQQRALDLEDVERDRGR